MPVLTTTDATVYEAHGSRFASYATPARGSEQLCAWRLDVPAGTTGASHRPSRDEILLVLQGRFRITLDEDEIDARVGDVVLVPADSDFCIDTDKSDASAWVTTTPGLEAVMADGSRLAPPWAR